MSTVTPVTVAPQDDEGHDAARETLVHRLNIGTRILEHLRLEQRIDGSDSWTLYLADDEERSELVLVVVALSEDALVQCLSGVARGDVVKKTTLQSLHVAEVALEEKHLHDFGEELLKGPVVENPTLESPNPKTARLLSAGGLFAGRYRIDEVLGRGGMGEVYRAYDETFQRAVALKIVRVDTAATDMEHREEAKRRLLHEARVVSALKHPHIVEIYDAGENDGLPYLVLELCTGGSLRTAMSKNIALDEKVRWLTEIADALAYAHGQGVIHRDVKPENVILTDDRRAKVADFGIAKALKQDTNGNSTLGIVGTPRYMAPEQLMGAIVDGRADQYAWGLVAYELLMKRNPRLPTTVSRNPSDMKTAISRAPANVRRIIARAIESSPAARYKHFHQILEELRGAPPRRPWRSVLGVVAALGVATAVLMEVRVSKRAGNDAQSPDVQAPLSFNAEAIDADIVHRCAPAARPHLAAGLQLWRDASQWEAVPRLDRATELDPECAAASVYYLLAATHTLPKRREHFRHGREQRANLNERERQLLEALEPSMADPPDLVEMQRRTAALVDRYPTDLDVRKMNARALRRIGRLDDALAAIEATAALAPRPIPANEFEAAIVQEWRRDTDAAFDRFGRCLQVSPDSADCLQWKGLLLASKGRCADAENTLHHLTSVMPQNEHAHFVLANILLMSTKDPAVARGAFEERWRHFTADKFDVDATPETARIADEYRMTIVNGQLDRALELVRNWNKLVAAMPNGRFRGDPLIELIELLREIGKEQEARTLALKGLKEHRTWSGDEKLDVSIELARLAYLTGGIDVEQYRRVRDDWRQRRTRTATEIWLGGFAGLPVVGEEMAPPVAPGEYVQDWYNMSSESFSRTAVELIRIGRIQDAIRHADGAAKSCLIFKPMSYIHALVAAAKAHDALGDKAVACTHYSAVQKLLARTSHSISLNLARARSTELECSKQKHLN